VRSPEPAVLFYVTDDDRAEDEVERLIRTAGFEPVRAGGIEGLRIVSLFWGDPQN
jgi:8-hydroxy-5-deazaflavin:NADPH oxidoreductase